MLGREPAQLLIRTAGIVSGAMRARRPGRLQTAHRLLTLSLEPRDDFAHPDALLFRQRRRRPSGLPGCCRCTDAVRHDLTHYLFSTLRPGSIHSTRRRPIEAPTLPAREDVIDCGIVRSLTAAWPPVAGAFARRKTHDAHVNCRRILLSSSLTAQSLSAILNIANTLLRIVIGTTAGCWNRKCTTCD